MMISGENTGNFTEEVKSPCTVCRQSVHSNTVQFQFLSCWMHEICSGIRRKLKEYS